MGNEQPGGVHAIPDGANRCGVALGTPRDDRILELLTHRGADLSDVLDDKQVGGLVQHPRS